MSTHARAVVLGVGPETSGGGIRFAAVEAVRLNLPLHLVHVVHPVAQGPEFPLVVATDPSQGGRLLLAGVQEQAEDLVGGRVPIVTDMVVGRVVTSLVGAAQEAAMVVLEHREGGGGRLVTRSVASGVAARARVPVVSVPFSWVPRTGGDAPRLVVGIDNPEECADLFRAALAEARSREAELTVLHVWYHRVRYGPGQGMAEEDAWWQERMTARIETALGHLSDEAAGVPITIEIEQPRPADKLLAASRTHDLVILGRHDPFLPIGSHLGPIVRTVLRETASPVLLVAPTRRPAMD